jgi:hypothetical protein
LREETKLRANRRTLVVLIVVSAAVAAILSTTYVADLGRSSSSLPPGCNKPAGGFLIIASNAGFNDSEGHGAPSQVWPIITVKQGSTVTVTVCDTDRQAHSFQIGHYLEGSQNTMVPGQVLQFSFVAAQAGTFQIYCEIFCTIHIYMQNGQLRVTQ